MSGNIKVSLVSTVLNDREGVELMLDDLEVQTRLPDEFAVVDGGSNDGTYEYMLERAKSLPFKLIALQEKGANVSRGRNLAIETAANDVIISTDFGCRLDADWVKELAAPFEQDPTVEIVTGSWRIRDEDIHTPAQWAEWALCGRKIQLIATPTCFASTRSIAFKRQVWRDFGKYPEDLTLSGDDGLFARWMVVAGRKIAAAPRAMCYWHRHEALKGFFKESRVYSRGMGESLFMLNYGVKVGFMLLLEILSLCFIVSAAIAVLLGASWHVLAAGSLAALLVWSRRVWRCLKCTAVLAKAGLLRYWPWVFALDFGRRWHGVLSYWRGFFHGFRHCQACRAKMRQLRVPRW
jgi:GT2 family glycosyltransferase